MATLNPYIHLADTASEAIDFYQSVFGGEVTKMTFGQGGMADNPADADKIMHAQLETSSGFTLMAADTPSHIEANPGDSISISLSGPASDEAELRGYYEKLVAGGSNVLPLEKAPWGDSFGMCKDRFGIEWLVNISGS